MSEQVPPESPSPYPRSTIGGSPPMIITPTAEEKTQATILWVLIFFAGFVPLLSFIPGLIFLLIARDKPYVYRSAAMSLIFWFILIALYIVFSAIIMVGLELSPVFLTLLSPVMWLLLFILGLVTPFMGAIAAKKGETFNPPVLPGLTEKIFKV